jgi:hypothetical protein
VIHEYWRIELKIKIAFCRLFFVLFLGFVCGGCSSRGIPVEVIDSGAKETIKQSLASTLETGALGSEEILIDENIMRLTSDDATMGAEIKKLFEDLKKAKTPTAVKAKAKEIIGKL